MQGQSRRRYESILLIFCHVALPDVEFEEGSVKKVGADDIKTKFEGKLEAFGHVHHAIGCHTVLVRRKCHDRVRAKQSSIDDQARDIVQSLIEQDLLPDARLSEPRRLVVLVCCRG